MPWGKKRESLCGPIHPVVDQLVDDVGIGQGRDVPESVVLVGGDLAKNSPHDLTGPGLRQTRRSLQQVGSRNRADLLTHPRDELAPQFLVWGFRDP